MQYLLYTKIYGKDKKKNRIKMKKKTVKFIHMRQPLVATLITDVENS